MEKWLNKFTQVFRDLGVLQRSGLKNSKIQSILKSKYSKKKEKDNG